MMPRLYAPSPQDILSVHSILAHPKLKLPPELIEIIVEHAEYWARITTRLKSGFHVTAIGRATEHVRILRSKPICVAAADEGHWVDAGQTLNMDLEANNENFDMDSERAMQSDAEYQDRGLKRTLSNDPLDDANFELVERNLDHTDVVAKSSITESRYVHPVRRITWNIRSKDQGWGGEGGRTYEKSWTGFRGNALRYHAGPGTDKEFHEYGSDDYLTAWERLEKSTSDAEELNEEHGYYVDAETDDDRVWPHGDWCFSRKHIQVNQRAKRDFKDHTIVWDCRDRIEAIDPEAPNLLTEIGRGIDTGNGDQVQALSRGDCIELHAYAFFPGWTNTIEEAEIILEFAL